MNRSSLQGLSKRPDGLSEPEQAACQAWDEADRAATAVRGRVVIRVEGVLTNPHVVWHVYRGSPRAKMSALLPNYIGSWFPKLAEWRAPHESAVLCETPERAIELLVAAIQVRHVRRKRSIIGVEGRQEPLRSHSNLSSLKRRLLPE